MKQTQTLSALFSFPGFRVRSRLRRIFGDPHARLVVLVRRKKLPCAPAVGRGPAPSTTARRAGCGIPMRWVGASICRLYNLGVLAGSARMGKDFQKWRALHGRLGESRRRGVYLYRRPGKRLFEVPWRKSQLPADRGGVTGVRRTGGIRRNWHSRRRARRGSQSLRRTSNKRCPRPGGAGGLLLQEPHGAASPAQTDSCIADSPQEQRRENHEGLPPDVRQ